MTSATESTPTFPDAALVARARARDASAFAELVEEQAPRLRRLVDHMLKIPSDREEVLQNALLAAWVHLPAFEGRAQFGSWLHRVTANTALMHLRRQRRQCDHLVGDLNELVQAEAKSGQRPICQATACWIERPDDALQRTEFRALVQRKLGELSPVLREVFVLRYVEEFSTKETADKLGVTEPTVKTRLHRACLELRAAIHSNVADLGICGRNPASGSTDGA
jgi:RNA polymerase sigma-70 factor (ECF subfamily)